LGGEGKTRLSSFLAYGITPKRRSIPRRRETAQAPDNLPAIFYHLLSCDPAFKPFDSYPATCFQVEKHDVVILLGLFRSKYEYCK
jgi:hypothetical protein